MSAFQAFAEISRVLAPDRHHGVRIGGGRSLKRRNGVIVSRASITKSHQKIQELAWEPTFVSPVERFATDYTFERAPKKDPLKQVLRSYFPMEEEKDNRVFGAMDGAIRGNMFRQVQERWGEGVAEAFPVDHPVPGDPRRPRDAAHDRHRPQS